MLLILAPNFFTTTSNGHLACLKIWKNIILSLGSHNVRVISGSECPASVDLYQKNFQTSYSNENDIVCKGELLLDSNYSLLLPDDTEGTRSLIVDDLKKHSLCKRIYVIAYAPLFVFSQKEEVDDFEGFDERYRLIFFSDWIMPRSLRLANSLNLYQEPKLPVELEQRVPSNVKQDKVQSTLKIAIYAGKGIYKLSKKNQQSFAKIVKSLKRTGGEIKLITRNNPPNKDQLYSLLAECNLLVCLDPFSNLEREALVLGCRVWKPNAGEIGQIPGIYYGEISEGQLDCIFKADPFEKKRISETYLQYSNILERSSKTRLELFLRALAFDIESITALNKVHTQYASSIAKRFIFKATEELKVEAKITKSLYAQYIHPMKIIPEMNNSLTLESVVNLLSGKILNDMELTYSNTLANGGIHF